MSDCPKCGLPAEHIAVTFPIHEVGGEITVLHRCGNHEFFEDFEEPARDPLGLIAQVMETLAYRYGLPAKPSTTPENPYGGDTATGLAAEWDALREEEDA